MKHALQFRLLIIAAGVFACGCFTDSNHSSKTKQRQADEIDAIDFSILNDRSHWVDPAWLP